MFIHIRPLADDGFRSDHLSVRGFIHGEVYSALLQYSLLACTKDFKEYDRKESVPGDLCDCPAFSLFILGEGLAEWLMLFSNLSCSCLGLQLLGSWVCTTKPGTQLPWETLVPTYPYIWICTDLLFPITWYHVSMHVLVTPSHKHGDFSKCRNLFSSISAT